MAQVEAWLLDAFDNARLSTLDERLRVALMHMEKKEREGK
jgi:hypothetical protein